MYATIYHRPANLESARTSFAAGEDAAYLSGGHTLIPAMKARLAAPSDLIDLTRIPALRGIAVVEGRLEVGAAETHAYVAASEIAARAIPSLPLLAGSIGDPQVRHRGTIGGSVANNDPAADYPAAVLALDAVIHTTDRALAAEDYFQGLYTTALKPGEILTRIGFELPEAAGYAKVRNPASRYALAAVFVARFPAGVRVAVTGAGSDGVFRWHEAEAALSARFDPSALTGLALDPTAMIGDMHAEPAFRAHLTAVCARRAVAGIGGITLD